MRKKEPNTDTLANSLADQIRREITEKGFQEGDLFMTGDEVAERYGVSRGITREAISQLRVLGALKSRQRKGLLVGRSDPVSLLDHSLPFYGKLPRDLRALEQLRYVLEVGAVELAVANATEEQRQRLIELAGKFREETLKHDRNEKTIDEIELEFHGLILQMTDSPLISGMHQVLSAYFNKAVDNTTFNPQLAQEQACEHEAIAEGIQRRDLEMARAYLRRHLRWVLADKVPIE